MILSLAAEQKGIMRLCTDVLRIAAPVLIVVALAYFLSDRVDGFGYVYGSNLALGKDDASRPAVRPFAASCCTP